MVAVIGTGSMGSAIAEGLLAAGHRVIVFNRTREMTEPLVSLGATVAESAADALASSELAIVVLPDAASTRELLFDDSTVGALSDRVIMNVAHTSPEEILGLAADVREAGGSLSEVNVTVYPDFIRSRKGHFNLACAPSDLDSWLEVFGDLGDHVHNLGDVGNASRAECALWLSYMFLPAAVAFSAAAFSKLGLPKGPLVSALSENPTLQIASSEPLIRQMQAREYMDDLYSVDNFAYSVDHVIPDAAALGLPTRLFEDIRDLFLEASRLGHGSSDISAVYEVLLGDSEIETE
ncbi:MAG: NAD(P)-dependent oxidoreductase [Thermomicrobiales bacterium]|nr:NAD(P)-dependent oxidoreductase [Thermomicrobiales bacterium]